MSNKFKILTNFTNMKKLNLKALRIDTGLKQSQFAEKLDISQSAVSRYEIMDIKIGNPFLKKCYAIWGEDYVNSFFEEYEDESVEYLSASILKLISELKSENDSLKNDLFTIHEKLDAILNKIDNA